MTEIYELAFRGEAGPTLRAAFPEYDLRSEHGTTVLVGEFVDQAALHGVIERINALGLQLVDVHVVDDGQSASEHTGHRVTPTTVHTKET